MTLVLSSGLPGILLASAALILLVFFTLHTARGAARVVGVRRASVLGGLRGASFAVILLLLLGPIIASSAPHGARAHIALLIDASRSMQWPGDAAATGPRTRLAEALDAHAVLTRASGLPPLRTSVVDRTVRPATAASLAPDSLAARPPAARAATALGEALARLARTAASDGLTGVILVSDGASTLGRDPTTAARELGVPVLAVGVGAGVQSSDLAVASVTVPDVAFAGESTGVAVMLRSRGFGDRLVTVTLAEGARPLATHTARVGANSDASVPLTLPALAPGRHFLTARVDSVPGEITAENDASTAALDVRDTRERVLILCGSVNWDLRFVRDAIAGDPSVELVTLARRGDAWETGGESAPAAPPQSAAALAGYRAVVLVNASSFSLPQSTQAAIAAYVASGGSLWWITGSEATGTGGAGALLGGPLGSIAPLAREASRGATFASVIPALTGGGAASALTALDADAATSAEVWQSLPPIAPGDPTVAARAGASVLVNGRPAGGRVSEQSPALILTREDAGRVLVWNGSGFWRWRLAATEDDRLVDVQPTLVRAAMTWLLVDRAQGGLVVTPAAPVTRFGETMHFAASLRGSPVGADVELELRRAGGAGVQRAAFRLAADSASFLADVDDLAPGRYTYAARAVRGGRVLGTAGGEVFVDARSLDADDVGVSEDAMRAIGRESGGAYVRATDTELVGAARRLARTPRETMGPRVELWSHPVALLLALSLLGAEWFLRKRWGLL